MQSCGECNGSGFEWLLTFKARCEVCMGTDDNDTNPSTPNAKKSSGTWTLNLDGAPCARCRCRRDAHATRGGGSHRWECMNCDACPEFVIGGEVVDYSGLADTQPESK